MDGESVKSGLAEVWGSVTGASAMRRYRRHNSPRPDVIEP